jgi:hypothetical protein
MVQHRPDRPDGKAIVDGFAHVDQQNADPIGRLGTFLARRGAHQQHH